jgi:hypothetical protein
LNETCTLRQVGSPDAAPATRSKRHNVRICMDLTGATPESQVTEV